MPDNTQKQRKLGRGLSSLLGLQVPVEVSSSPPVVAITAAMPSTTPRPTSASPAPAKSPQSIKPPPPPTSPATAPDTSGLVMLPVDSIVPNRFQPRRSFDDQSISQLADSIRRSGLMQPIVVRPSKGMGSSGGVATGGSAGTAYELVAGERRWRAAKLAGLSRIPALVRDLVDEEAAEWAVVENIQREDLNPMDRAYALRNLVDRFGLSHAEIAEKIGLDRATVANFIRLTDLEPEIASMVASGVLSAGHAKAILSAPAGTARLDLARKAAAGAWTVRLVEDAARRAAQESGTTGGKPARKKIDEQALARIAVARDMERRLSAHLGTKVAIDTDRQGKRGRVMIEFYSLDHFEGLMERIGMPREQRGG